MHLHIVMTEILEPSQSWQSNIALFLARQK